MKFIKTDFNQLYSQEYAWLTKKLNWISLLFFKFVFNCNRDRVDRKF